MTEENAKPKVGIFDFTCCNGCTMTIVNCEDELLDIAGAVDITNFRLARGTDSEALKPGTFRDHGPFDIAFVEGSISTKEEEEHIKDIRKNSEFLVSLGTCNATGGLQGMIHNKIEYPDPEAVKKIQHPDGEIKIQEPILAKPMGKIVRVDYEIRGCPITRKGFLNTVKQLLLGKMPEIYRKSVCLECKVNGNPCIYTDTKAWVKYAFGVENAKDEDLIKYDIELCMGPITQGGCDALCPGLARGCQGCRGPVEDANLKAFIELLEERNMPKDEIHRIITKFGGYTDKLEEFKWK